MQAILVQKSYLLIDKENGEVFDVSPDKIDPSGSHLTYLGTLPKDGITFRLQTKTITSVEFHDNLLLYKGK